MNNIIPRFHNGEPFVMIPIKLIAEIRKTISAEDFAFYGQMLAHVWTNSFITKEAKDSPLIMTNAELAKVTGISERSVKVALHNLIAAGVMSSQVMRSRTKGGSWHNVRKLFFEQCCYRQTRKVIKPDEQSDTSWAPF